MEAFCTLDARREKLEVFAMFFVVSVVEGDFFPESGRVIHVVDVGEFVNDNVVAKRFWDVHESDIEGYGARTTATTPASIGVGEAEILVGIAVFLSPKFKAIG